ncbi:MAG TPA: TonB-dependent receptor plug domain-containing protein [Bacteroidia bacterium]|nr:TonB-dependent receptor plug domain-containing protein [Bacteroidia bacterium]HRE24025.1 TonB-dependent receptor plug domain-containing protein [Bacteroidia bacterium]
MYNYYLLFISFLICTNIQAQTDTFHIKVVNIEALRQQDATPGIKFENIDSISLKQFNTESLSDLLSAESGVIIKNYGPGSLASSTIRGGNANQTAVIWNGFNINNPMLGQTDLSVIPEFFADKISMQYGGGSAQWGSGAVGGAVLLNSATFFNKGVDAEVNIGAGSYGWLRQSFKTNYSNNRWIFNLKAFNDYSSNNFRFQNSITLEKQFQKHARTQGQGVLSEIVYRINKNGTLSIAAWLDKFNRQIPPVLNQTSDAKQKDDNLRITSQWRQQLPKGELAVRAAWFNQDIYYSDSLKNINATSKAKSLLAEAEYKFHLGKHREIHTGINNNYTTATADEYKKEAQLNSFALFIGESAHFFNNKLKPSVSFRKEFIDNKKAPFTWYAGGEIALFKKISLKLNAASVYRNPTLNDLYWQPGGNKNLEPESGKTGDIGLCLSEINIAKNIYVKTEITLFNRKMKNQIIWLPENGYWSSQNLNRTESKGIETKTNIRYNYQKWFAALNVSTNYIEATNEKARFENDASVGKQLIYVPMYSGNGSIAIGFDKLIVKYTIQYSGYRYTTTDNLEYLEPFWLHGFYAACSLTAQKIKFQLYFKINNLFDENYETIRNRPMPLHSYKAGIIIQINSKSK